jgi:dUTP pyrophosphatase
MVLKVNLLNENAIAPKRGSEGAAGYDLFSSEDIEVGPHSQALIPTGIAIQMPDGVYGRIAPRSGLSLKHTITSAGVIDPDYRGEIKVIFFNLSEDPINILAGHRVAQLILEKFTIADVFVTDLSSTERSDAGFGSTGV